jgi:hypothetical protein
MRNPEPVSARRRYMRPAPWLLALGILLAIACANLEELLWGTPEYAPTSEFRMERANRGVEAYSAWFADTGGRILYFGLSPFWELWWRTGGDPRADLAKPGDHLIGRFDLEREIFLPPLRVRSMGFDSRSSVWDVLVHSNGRIYYTTYFEEIGSVNPDGSDVRAFSGLGAGFNELYEGPGGHIYVTRYSDAPYEVERQRYGAVVVLTPEGELVREIRFERDDQRFTLRLAPDGRVLSREVAPPELQFVHFDARGRGYFAESLRGAFRLRITVGERELAVIPLGPRNPLDFIQDIHFTARGDALLAFWSGRVTLVRQEGSAFRSVDLLLLRPERCVPPQGQSLLYSAVAFGERIYATLYCGASILSAPFPTRASAWR